MATIRKYAVRFHGGPEGSGTGIRAQIHLFDGNLKLVGWVNFFDDAVFLPADQKSPHIVLSLPLAAMPSVMAMMAKEDTPVYLYWQEKIQNAYLGTGMEPV